MKKRMEIVDEPAGSSAEKKTDRYLIRTSLTERKLDRLLKEKRVLHVYGPIVPGLTASLELDVFSADFEKEPDKPVWVLVNSVGGEVYSGLAIIDLLRMLDKNVPVHTVATGLVASMAIPILQAGRRRFATANSHFLVHQLSLMGRSRDEINELEEEVEEAKRLNRRILKLISERVGIEEAALIRDSKKKDLIFPAEDAIRYGRHGLVDEILTEIPF